MDDLKEVVTRTLEKKGVLAKIRAELRASVFTAIDEQEGKEGGLAAQGSARSSRLHGSAQGQLVAELVREYLEWCELEYTLKVFLPEVNTGDYMGRTRLEEKLGMRPTPPDSDGEKPLLLSLLDAFQRGGGPSNPASPSGMGVTSRGELKSPEGSESPILSSMTGVAAAGQGGGSRSPPPDTSPEGGSGSMSPFVVTRDGSAFVKDSSEDLYSTVRRAETPAAASMGGVAEEEAAGESSATAPVLAKPLGGAGLGKLDPLPALGSKRLGGLEPLAPLRTGMGGLAPLGGGEGGGAGGLAPLRGAPPAPLPQGAGGVEEGGGEEEGLDKSRSTSHVSPRGAAAEVSSEEGSIGEEFEVEEDEGLALDDGGSEDSYVFADDTHTSLMSKGQSMDLMVSGLSASDRSGELDGSDNDFMESAEIS